MRKLRVTTRSKKGIKRARRRGKDAVKVAARSLNKVAGRLPKLDWRSRTTFWIGVLVGIVTIVGVILQMSRTDKSALEVLEALEESGVSPELHDNNTYSIRIGGDVNNAKLHAIADQLEGLPYPIRDLKIVSEEVTNITPLSRFKEVIVLTLALDNLRDIDSLKYLSRLKEVTARYSSISDLTALEKLTDLTYLNLGDTRVSDLGPLRSLRKLTKLYLENTRVSDLEPLRGLGELRSLDLESTGVSDLGPLRDLRELKTLDVRKTQVSDLGPLQYLTKLQLLRLDRTMVRDLTPLLPLTGLTDLDVCHTMLRDSDEKKLKSTLPRLRIRRNMRC